MIGLVCLSDWTGVVRRNGGVFCLFGRSLVKKDLCRRAVENVVVRK